MKTWETPKLIVLVRTGPTETVLEACKYHTVLQGDPNNVVGACTWELPDGQGACLNCESQLAS